jgi:basic amino acid/polyamine antiporter, APA family
MENTQKRKFGLLTTVAMIVGIVIGSGIFFKTDNILAAVDGSVSLGVLAFIIGGAGIVFGGLTIAVLAKRDENVGGLITYCEMTWGKTLGYLAGWFQTTLYYPPLVAVIAWVSAMYTSMLFGWTDSTIVLGMKFESLPAWPFPFTVGVWVISLLAMILFFIFNAFQTKLAGKFQSAAMITKVSALIVLGITGIAFGDPVSTVKFADWGMLGGGFFLALVPIAYAYDGWQVAPSVAHEIKNPKRNLPLALTFAPLMIMGIYVAYFIGINAVLGPQTVLELGDGAVSVFAQQFFGAIGYKVVLTAVVISVLGTLNGLILGYIRLPYALGLRNELPLSKQFSSVDPKTDIPMFSALFTFVLSLFWLLLHFATTVGVIVFGWKIFSGVSVDELSIVLIYIFMVTIYLGVIKDFLVKKVGSWIQNLVFPLLAVIGALTAIYGGFLSPMVATYLVICLLVILAGLFVRPKQA